jgi:hypothetical protein
VKHAAFPRGITREDLVQWYRAGRSTSKAVFSIPAESAYYDRPIELRNPIVFYEGHLPAFSVNTLIKLALKGTGSMTITSCSSRAASIPTAPMR